MTHTPSVVRIRPYHFAPESGYWGVYVGAQAFLGDKRSAKAGDRAAQIRAAIRAFRAHLAERRYIESRALELLV